MTGLARTVTVTGGARTVSVNIVTIGEAMQDGIESVLGPVGPRRVLQTWVVGEVSVEPMWEVEVVGTMEVVLGRPPRVLAERVEVAGPVEDAAARSSLGESS